MVFMHTQHPVSGNNKVNCGENIAWGYPSRFGFDSTQAWYNEIVDTEGGLGLTDTMNGPSGEALGHYTQIVWKGSTRLGCGVGRATTKNLEGDFWVCQYCKGGNYQGQFADNVSRPSRHRQSAPLEVLPHHLPRRRPRLLQSNLHPLRHSLRRRLPSISKIVWLLTPLVHVRNVLTIYNVLEQVSVART